MSARNNKSEECILPTLDAEKQINPITSIGKVKVINEPYSGAKSTYVNLYHIVELKLNL